MPRESLREEDTTFGIRLAKVLADRRLTAKSLGRGPHKVADITQVRRWLAPTALPDSSRFQKLLEFLDLPEDERLALELAWDLTVLKGALKKAGLDDTKIENICTYYACNFKRLRKPVPPEVWLRSLLRAIFPFNWFGQLGGLPGTLAGHSVLLKGVVGVMAAGSVVSAVVGVRAVARTPMFDRPPPPSQEAPQPMVAWDVQPMEVPGGMVVKSPATVVWVPGAYCPAGDGFDASAERIETDPRSDDPDGSMQPVAIYITSTGGSKLCTTTFMDEEAVRDLRPGWASNIPSS